jgi:hypothetical protein
MYSWVTGGAHICAFRPTAIIGRLLLAMTLTMSACATAADSTARRQAADFVAASRDALACRNTVAAKHRYQALATHLPLTTVFNATLLQMADSNLASEDDIVTLGLWLDDMQECRNRLVADVLRTFPTALASVVVNWNKDDRTFVLLAKRKLVWGEAIMTLRTNRAEMLDQISRQILQLAQQLNAEKQAELTRRVAIFSALTNLSP